jgi:hypothetical protein
MRSTDAAARGDREPSKRTASNVKTATLTTLIVLCTYKNIFLLFFETPCDVASAQRALKKRF